MLLIKNIKYQSYFSVFILFILLITPLSVLAETDINQDYQDKSELYVCPNTIVLSNSKNRQACLDISNLKQAKRKDFFFKLGDSLKVRASGSYIDEIKKAWQDNSPITLYFDGEPIASLQIPPQIAEDKQTLFLDFTLIRNAENDDNRHSWEKLLKKHKEFIEMTIQPALAINNELPLSLQSAQPLTFCVSSSAKVVVIVLLTGTLLFLVSYYLLISKTAALKDADSGYYSLGKSQMAFWGLMVIISFTGVWILTGTIERIPPQLLVLLGISGATGLSASVIGNMKKPSDAALDLSLKTVSQGFWKDICNDGNGMSFHRLQVVGWTLVLGAVFVGTIADIMSMPEFSDTLLSLMGVSNATYLGFKIPEKS